MADEKKRLDSNVAGNFFVDATCINCDTCRQLAPTSFEEVGSFSAVTQQPTDEGHTQQAYQALLAMASFIIKLSLYSAPIAPTGQARSA